MLDDNMRSDLANHVTMAAQASLRNVVGKVRSFTADYVESVRTDQNYQTLETLDIRLSVRNYKNLALSGPHTREFCLWNRRGMKFLKGTTSTVAFRALFEGTKFRNPA